MNLKKFLRKERIIWHKHFAPSLIAGVAVAIIALIFKFTAANIVLFASVGASAAILSNIRSHHLTKLHTIIASYVVAIIISLILYFINLKINLPLALNLFLAVFLTSILIFLVNSFHPPAISASASFILFERGLKDLFYLFIAMLVLFIIIRFLTYTLSQHLSVKEFWKEFKREF
ncbi:HPP family protein [Candidatus Woesearchaeota archaeon]|nr:HPP family protein [Candidatus Woesearchaeota archaeon]